MSRNIDNKGQAALVLFSGGQDSTICLAHALDTYTQVETIGFDYGQRHDVELRARKNVLHIIRQHYPAWAQKLGKDHVVSVSGLAAIGETALTHEKAIVMGENGLPTSFVPGRNLIFLTYAAALAYRRNINVLVGGMCETDYSGYPDCRHETLLAQMRALCLGLAAPFELETPLMYCTKAQSWKLAENLGGAEFVATVVEHSHTCYHGDRERRHDWGYGCGQCPACTLREKGWRDYQADGIANM